MASPSRKVSANSGDFAERIGSHSPRPRKESATSTGIHRATSTTLRDLDKDVRDLDKPPRPRNSRANFQDFTVRSGATSPRSRTVSAISPGLDSVTSTGFRDRAQQSNPNLAASHRSRDRDQGRTQGSVRASTPLDQVSTFQDRYQVHSRNSSPIPRAQWGSTIPTSSPTCKEVKGKVSNPLEQFEAEAQVTEMLSHTEPKEPLRARHGSRLQDRVPPPFPPIQGQPPLQNSSPTFSQDVRSLQLPQEVPLKKIQGLQPSYGTSLPKPTVQLGGPVTRAQSKRLQALLNKDVQAYISSNIGREETTPKESTSLELSHGTGAHNHPHAPLKIFNFSRVHPSSPTPWVHSTPSL